VGVEKLTHRKVVEKNFAMGSPTNDDLRFGRHFYLQNSGCFDKTGVFQQPRPGYNSYFQIAFSKAKIDFGATSSAQCYEFLQPTVYVLVNLAFSLVGATRVLPNPVCRERVLPLLVDKSLLAGSIHNPGPRR